MMYTTTQAARFSGLARRTIQRWCKELGFLRFGRDYVLTEKQLAYIQQVAQKKPGRPSKSTQVSSN